MSKRVTRSSARPVAPGATVVVRSSTYLGARAGQVRPEHNCPWRLVIKLLAACLEAIFEKFDVSSAAVAAVLVLHLILDDERLVCETNSRAEWRANSVMRSLGLRDKTLIAHNSKFIGVLDRPFADIAVCFSANRRLLGRF